MGCACGQSVRTFNGSAVRRRRRRRCRRDGTANCESIISRITETARYVHVKLADDDELRHRYDNTKASA